MNNTILKKNRDFQFKFVNWNFSRYAIQKRFETLNCLFFVRVKRVQVQIKVFRKFFSFIHLTFLFISPVANFLFAFL